MTATLPSLPKLKAGLVVEAEQVEERGVEVVHMDRVGDDIEAKVVGFAMDVWPARTPPPARRREKTAGLAKAPMRSLRLRLHYAVETMIRQVGVGIDLRPG